MFEILVIEDDLDIQEVLRNYLTEAGYRVDLADDGVEGLASFRRKKPDLVLLDVMLPRIDGFGVLELIRQESQVPVLMVTARDSLEDQIRGFKLLVDDYITKPFDIPLLLCKVEAVLRRTGKCLPSPGMGYRDLTMDQEEHRVYLAGEEIELTGKEFELLRVFLTNQGRVFTRQSLLDAVWGIDYFGDERIVDTHIKNLRKKLGADYIRTVRGVGYRMEKEKSTGGERRI